MPSLATVAAPEEREATAAFSVHTRAEPGIMPRLIELFAKRGLVPTRWHSALSRDERDLSIEIEMKGLAREMTDYIAACMRQIVGVEVVLTSCGAPARHARGAGARTGG
jgi:acetolactate synthase small subunit